MTNKWADTARRLIKESKIVLFDGTYDINENLLEECIAQALEAASASSNAIAKMPEFPTYKQLEEYLVINEDVLDLQYDWSITAEASYDWLRSRLTGVV